MQPNTPTTTPLSPGDTPPRQQWLRDICSGMVIGSGVSMVLIVGFMALFLGMGGYAILFWLIYLRAALVASAVAVALLFVSLLLKKWLEGNSGKMAVRTKVPLLFAGIFISIGIVTLTGYSVQLVQEQNWLAESSEEEQNIDPDVAQDEALRRLLIDATYEIEAYARANTTLPPSLTVLKSAKYLAESNVRYSVISDTVGEPSQTNGPVFELCAPFRTENIEPAPNRYGYALPTSTRFHIHVKGDNCFKVMLAQSYPPGE